MFAVSRLRASSGLLCDSTKVQKASALRSVSSVSETTTGLAANPAASTPPRSRAAGRCLRGRRAPLAVPAGERRAPRACGCSRVAGRAREATGRPAPGSRMWPAGCRESGRRRAHRGQQVQDQAVDKRDHDEGRPHPGAAQAPADLGRPKRSSRSTRRRVALGGWTTSGSPSSGGSAIATASRSRHSFGSGAQAAALPDLLLVLEHPPVYTKGRRSEPGDLPMGRTGTEPRASTSRDRSRRARDLPRSRASSWPIRS